jgi:DNA-binding MarR family transcriptional regulator
MPMTFREITRIVEQRLQIKALTHEYEIISCFFDRESLAPKELLSQSSASNTAFYNSLTGLESRGLLRSEVSNSDRRSKTYHLSDFTKEVLREQWLEHTNNVQIYRGKRSEKKLILHRYFESTNNRLNVRHLTCEYQIILLLSNVYGMTNIEITDLVDVSATKFNKSLKYLANSGLIYHEGDNLDRRKKHYYLSDLSKSAIDEWRKHMAIWVREKSMGPVAG